MSTSSYARSRELQANTTSSDDRLLPLAQRHGASSAAWGTRGLEVIGALVLQPAAVVGDGANLLAVKVGHGVRV